MIDLALLWLALFGVWPLADPGHGLDTLGSATDVVIHVAASFVLFTRWKVVHR